jgi:hypothetical protein
LEVRRRYIFAEDPKNLLRKIRKFCLVCQACDRPNWTKKALITMTPIPDWFMSSVSLDIFQMPLVVWEGSHADAYLLCVDRHSGWVVARPTRYDGFTGEKAAHFMLDPTWGELAVPSVVTCHLGCHFVSQWWLTVCARLGVRVTFAHTYHHQSNGRAEVAGRIIQDVVRKLLIDADINWVEALPRTTRILHDTPDAITGLAPYEVVFGRERALAGLPWGPEKKCPEAADFFDRMKIEIEERGEIDCQVARALNEHTPPWRKS